MIFLVTVQTIDGRISRHTEMSRSGALVAARNELDRPDVNSVTITKVP